MVIDQRLKESGTRKIIGDSLNSTVYYNEIQSLFVETLFGVQHKNNS